MLSDEDIKKIRELINRGYKDYTIGKMLGHSPNTIINYRKEINKTKIKDNATGEETQFDDPIEEVRRILHNIDNLIKNEHLKAGENKKWEKRRDELKEMLRIEADDKIVIARANAIEERDNVWNKHVENKYVQKEVVIDLNNKLIAREATIENLKYEIDQKDQVIASNQQEKEDLNNQIGALLLENSDLRDENEDLNEFIEEYLDFAGRREREKLGQEEEDLIVKKTDLDIHIKRQRSNLDGLFVESEEKLKSAKKLELELDDKREKFKKREEKFDRDKKQLFDAFNKRIKSVEKREVNVKIAKKIVITQKEKNDLESKKIQNEMKKLLKERENINKAREELQKVIESF